MLLRRRHSCGENIGELGVESPRENIIRRSLRLKERIVSALSSQCRLSAGSNKEGMEQKALPFFSEDEAEDTEDESFAQLPSGIPFIDDSCEMLDILDIEENLVSTLGEMYTSVVRK